MGSINSEEIISILKTEIENYDMVTGEQEVGSVIWVGAVSYTHLTLPTTTSV